MKLQISLHSCLKLVTMKVIFNMCINTDVNGGYIFASFCFENEELHHHAHNNIKGNDIKIGIRSPISGQLGLCP